MADAPKILGSDTLKQAYPKLNQAIDNANEALQKSKMGIILTQNIYVDTVNKTVSTNEQGFIGHYGGYYTVPAQTVSYTGLNFRIQYVFLNIDTLTFEVYETGTVPSGNSQLLLLFSFYNGEVHFSTTPKKIIIDGKLGANILTSLSDLNFKLQYGTLIQGSIVVDTASGTVKSTNSIVSTNGKYITVADQTVNFSNPNNRIQYVYINETGTMFVYENKLAPADSSLILLFSFWKGKIYDNFSLSGITVDGKGVLDFAINTKGSGKIANFLGDSLTFGLGGTIPYPTVVKNQLGLATANNYGVSGSCVAIRNVKTDSFVERYSTMGDAQIIYVMGGTNDFWTNVPLGIMGDTDPTTYYGALDTLVKGLINKYPNAFICFGTPPKGWRESGYYNEGPNNNGNTMEEFNKAVKDVCGYYTIPVLDVKHELGIDPSIPIHFSTYTSDGIHYNDAGYERLGRLIAQFIQNKINI